MHDAELDLGNCLDLDFAARTGDGDQLLAGTTDEFAFGIARGLEECVQACRASRACSPGRTRRALWADAAACTVRTRLTRWAGRWTRWAWRTGRTRWPRWTRWTGWSGRPLWSLRPFKAAGHREAEHKYDDGDRERIAILPLPGRYSHQKSLSDSAPARCGASYGFCDAHRTTLAANASGSGTQTGGLLGMGVEYAFLPNWSAKLEYNYIDFDTRSFNASIGTAR